MRKKNETCDVIVVGMIDSVHTFRWMETAIHHTSKSFVLFPSGPHRRVHPKLFRLSQANPSRLRIKYTSISDGLFVYLIDRFLRTKISQRRLLTLIDAEECAAIHAMELQHSGYLAVSTLMESDLRSSIKLWVSNWGSDIYWFQKKKKHRELIKRLLSRADLYSAECERDYELAKSLGFKGEKITRVPNSPQKLDPAHELTMLYRARNRIAVKGYQGWSGMGLTAVLGICKARAKFRDYEIVVYSASLLVRTVGRLAFWFAGLRSIFFQKHSLDSSQMYELFRSSRIYLGVARTDGLSTSAVEAMICGAFPVQSSTSCLEEITKENCAVLIEKNSISGVSSALEMALQLSSDKTYMSKNLRQVQILFDYDSIGKIIREAYDSLGR